MVTKTNGKTKASLGLGQVTAMAITPDQLIPYVKAVSGLDSRMFDSCVGHICEGQVVLIGYPMENPHNKEALDTAVAQALQMPKLEHITVLSATPPSNMPEQATINEDVYMALPLPLPPMKQKVRNMIKRALRDIDIEEGSAENFGQEHEALVEAFCASRKLDAGMIHIFHQLKNYLIQARNTCLFSARIASGKDMGKLVAFAIGDYSSFSTAFYMFACRLPANSQFAVPPGTADALLHAVAKKGEEQGHNMLNLGLAINDGIGFFKKKWGAEAFLPCFECGWDIKQEKKGWFSRLFGG